MLRVVQMPDVKVTAVPTMELMVARRTETGTGYGIKIGKEDTIMKRYLKSIRTLAVLLMAGVAFVSCSKEEETALVGQTYSLTINASKGGDNATKQLVLDGHTLNATWAEGEAVTVYNVTKSADLTGSLVAQSSGVSTTLKGTLTGTIEDGDKLLLKFLSPSYSSQDGTLAYIATHCDYAEDTVTVTDASSSSVTTTDAEFENKQAIVKFTLNNKANDAAISATSLHFTDGTNTYTIKPASANSVLYAAIPGFSGRDIKLLATVGTTIYHYEKANVTFADGSYYEIAVKMTDFNTEATTNPTLNLFSDIDVEGFSFTITRADGVVDMNGHTITSCVYIQNNTAGKTVTLQNGTISSPGDGIDGKRQWDDYYHGTVRLINMTIPGKIFTDGHAFIFESGTYGKIENYYKNSGYPKNVIIYGGYFTDFNDFGYGNGGWPYVSKGDYVLYGGYYQFDPSTRSSDNVTIASGYHVETVSSGDYGWRVVPISSAPAGVVAVDLGLPSGTLWASCNIGATTPEGYGDYFAWGEVEPYYSSLSPLTWKSGKAAGYTWSSYRYDNSASHDGSSFSKYTGSDYPVLQPEDDAARYNWGINWRMPTNAELQELFDNTNSEWTTINGVKGLKLKKKTDASVFIFLPSGVGVNGTDVLNNNTAGEYWSSTDKTATGNLAYKAYFKYENNTLTVGNGIDGYRSLGRNVRAVLAQ